MQVKVCKMETKILLKKSIIFKKHSTFQPVCVAGMDSQFVLIYSYSQIKENP